MSNVKEMKAEIALVQKLPAAAAVKYRELEAMDETNRGRAHFAHDRAQEARRVLEGARYNLNHYDTLQMNQPRRPAKERAPFEEAVAIAEAEYAKRQRAADDLRGVGGYVFSNVRRWLEANSHRNFAVMPMPLVKRIGKESWAEAVTRTRAELDKVKEALERTRNAPLPAAMAKAIAANQVAALAEKGRADVSRLFQGRPALLAGDAYWGGDDKPDPRHLLAWVAPDMMLARLCEQVDAEADEAAALRPEEKSKALARLAVEILELERVEEAMIVAGANDHLAIPRRDDADPRAILSLASTVPGYSEED